MLGGKSLNLSTESKVANFIETFYEKGNKIILKVGEVHKSSYYSPSFYNYQIGRLKVLRRRKN